MSDDFKWTPDTHLIEAAWACLRCPDAANPDDVTRAEALAEFGRWLEGYTDSIYSLALVKAAEAFDLEGLVGSQFIAADGYPSYGFNTDEEAREMVKAWLMARAVEVD